MKHVGFSFHDQAPVLDDLLTRHPEMEFVQLQVNYADWGKSRGAGPGLLRGGEKAREACHYHGTGEGRPAG